MGLTAGEINILIRARDQASKVLGRVGNAADKMRKVVRRAGIVGAVALAGLAVAAAATFISFDSAMTKSIAIMGDLDDAMVETMEKTARDVAKTTTFSMTQAAESYFFLASAGLSAKQSVAALPQVAAFAQAGMFDMALATDLLTDAQSALGLTVDDTAQNIENMARVSDVLVKANTLANATVEQFSTALTREAGAALKSFKIDVEEGVAVLAAFADQGVKGELAGTGLSRILRIMTSAAVNNADAYERLGVEVFDATGNISNLADIVGDLEGALTSLTDEQRVAALEALGFTARIQGVILPLLGTSDAIREYEGALREAAGTTAEIAEKQLQSLGAQLSLLRSGFEDVLFTIGQQMEPGLRALVATLREDVIPAIEAGLPAALDRMRQVFDDLSPVLQQVARDIEILGSALRAVGEFILGNQAAIVAAIAAIGLAFAWVLPGPTGVLFGIGAIAAAIILLRTDVEELSPAMLELEAQMLRSIITFSKFAFAAGLVAAGIGAVTLNAGLMAAGLAGAGGAIAAATFAERRLQALSGTLIGNAEAALGAARTYEGLTEALSDSSDQHIRLRSESGLISFVLPRATVEVERNALALVELANAAHLAGEEIATFGRKLILIQEIEQATKALTQAFVGGATAAALAAGQAGIAALKEELDALVTTIAEDIPAIQPPPIAPPGDLGADVGAAIGDNIIDGIETAFLDRPAVGPEELTRILRFLEEADFTTIGDQLRFVKELADQAAAAFGNAVDALARLSGISTRELELRLGLRDELQEVNDAARAVAEALGMTVAEVLALLGPTQQLTEAEDELAEATDRVTESNIGAIGTYELMDEAIRKHREQLAALVPPINDVIGAFSNFFDLTREQVEDFLRSFPELGDAMDAAFLRGIEDLRDMLKFWGLDKEAIDLVIAGMEDMAAAADADAAAVARINDELNALKGILGGLERFSTSASLLLLEQLGFSRPEERVAVGSRGVRFSGGGPPPDFRLNAGTPASIVQHITVIVEERSPAAVARAVERGGLELGEQLVAEGV